MLAGAVAIQRMQAVAWRVAQILEDIRCVEHSQLAQGAALDVGRQLRLRRPFQISSVSVLAKEIIMAAFLSSQLTNG